MNLENGKGSSLPLPVSGSAHLSLSPRPVFSPSLFSFSQRPSASIRPAQRKPSSRAPSFLAAAANSVVPRPCVTARRGPLVGPVFHLLSEQDTSPSRNNHARFAWAIPSPADSAPLNTRSAAPQSHISTRASAAAQLPPIRVAEIWAAAVSPSQHVPTSVSDLPGFVSVVRSCRDLPFVLYCFVLIANARWTLFQGRRLPIVVASPSRPPFVAGFALGEFAPSFRVAPCLYLVLYHVESPNWPTPARPSHGAAAGCPPPVGRL